MSKTVAGLFQSERDARAAVREIEDSGLERDYWSYIDRESNQLGDQLTELGIPQRAAILYADGIKRGGVLVLIQALPDDVAEQIAALLHHYDLIDVEEGIEDLDQRTASEGATPIMPLASTLSGVYPGGPTIVPITGAEPAPGEEDAATHAVDLATDDREHPPHANY
jgi:hypothetical protein